MRMVNLCKKQAVQYRAYALFVPWLAGPEQGDAAGGYERLRSNEYTSFPDQGG